MECELVLDVCLEVWKLLCGTVLLLHFDCNVCESGM